MTTPDQAVSAAPAVASGGVRRAAERLRPALVPALVCFAVLVHWPVLSTPRFLDDYNQLAMTEGRYPSHPGPLDLYDFITDENRGSLIERGILPWWSHPNVELRFLRPLSSALLWADHRLFRGADPIFEHVHSMLWWALASFAVFALLRELFSRRVAVIGAFVFAIAPCHGFPLSWMANREALISTALGAFGLLSYARWRERRRARDAIAAFALFATAMLAGEYSLCFAGYVAAIEAARPRESIRARATGVACFALPVLVYLVTRHRLHYGAFGTGYYHDPLRDFGAYASSVPRRLAVLIATAWAGIDDRIWVGEQWWKLAVIATATVGVVAVPIRKLLRGLEGAPKRRAVWLLAGSALALAPVIAVGPSVRLLEIPMVGVSACVALVLDDVWFPRSAAGPSRGAQWAELVALALAFVHLVRAPIDSWLTHRYQRSVAATFARQMEWLHDRAEGKAMVVILRANHFQTLYVTPLMLDGNVPVRDLSFQSGRVLLLRTSPRAIDLVAGAQPLFPVGPEDLVRSDYPPLYPGDVTDVAGMRATVVALRDDGTPKRLHFEFDHDLNDPSYLWVIQKAAGFEEVKLPSPKYGEPLDM
jgi:hypothetical protein